MAQHISAKFETISIPHVQRDSEDFLDWSLSIPEDLELRLEDIIPLNPDNGPLYYFKTTEARYTVWWSKTQIRQEDLDETTAFHETPVHNQTSHDYCWAHASAENISDAMFRNGVDDKYTAYSRAFLVDFCDREEANRKYILKEGKHYCYEHSTFRALEFAMVHGVPINEDWMSPGCGSAPPTSSDVSEVSDAESVDESTTEKQHCGVFDI